MPCFAHTASYALAIAGSRHARGCIYRTDQGEGQVEQPRTASAIAIILVAMMITGCTTTAYEQLSANHRTYETAVPSPCRTLLLELRRAIKANQRGDAENVPVLGYPFLRTNRMLAKIGRTFADNPSGPAFEAWVDRLRALDRQATRLEIANLPDAAIGKLRSGRPRNAANREQLAQSADACSDRARKAKMVSNKHRRGLIAAVHVAQDYSDSAQTLGLFAVTSIPVRLGWENWKRDNLTTFSRPAANSRGSTQLIKYAPIGGKPTLTSSAVRSIIRRSRDRLLGIPEPSPRDQKRLLQAFAPVWLLPTGAAYDQPGHPAWSSRSGTIEIDWRRPTVFTRISHTIVDDRILLQLMSTLSGLANALSAHRSICSVAS